MSKSQPKRAQEFRLPTFPEEDDLRVYEDRIRLIQQIQQEWGPGIIASGVFSVSDIWSMAISALAGADDDEIRRVEALETFFAQPGVDSPIPNPREDDPTHTDLASELVAERTWHWGDQGFFLGLAVGMLLGPHAFGQNGGAR